MGLDFLRDFIFIGESVPLHMNQKRKKKKEAIIWLPRLTLTTVILARRFSFCFVYNYAVLPLAWSQRLNKKNAWACIERERKHGTRKAPRPT